MKPLLSLRSQKLALQFFTKLCHKTLPITVFETQYKNLFEVQHFTLPLYP